MAEVEKDNQVEQTADVVAQQDKIEATEQKDVTTAQDIELPKTAEEYKKALQSASSKKMNEFLKKFEAKDLSDIEAKIEKAKALEEDSGKVAKLTEELKALKQKISEYEPIVTQKQQADFLNKHNVDAEFADDFFVLYEKKLNADKSNSDEVIKQILEKHPNMSTVKINDIKTSGGGKGKEVIDEDTEKALNRMRKFAGLPTK